MDKITEKVYLGDSDRAREEERIKKNNIKRVLSLMGDLSPKYEDKSIVQKIIKLDDFPETNIIKYFKESIKFIDDSDKVFVHCFSGISRSATLVIAYFMWKNKMSYLESFEFVKKQREDICPNIGFKNQLLIFEKKLKEANYNLDKIDFNKIVWPPKEGIANM